MGISLNIIKDQSLTLSVEEWLKTNEPHKLKMGESLGEVKQRLGSSTKTVEENVANEKERERRIIKKEKPAPTINKLEIQQKAVKEFREKCQHGDRERFVREHDWATTHTISNASKKPVKNDLNFKRLIDALENFKFSEPKQKVTYREKSAQNREINRLRDEAMAEGKNRFYAVCKRHRLTEYKITWNDIPRCVLCVNEASRKSALKKRPAERIEKLEIQKANRLKMQEAHENGKRNFMGICQKHGEEFFWIQKSPNTLSGLQYKCCQCNIKS